MTSYEEEIQEHRLETFQTRRPTVFELEEILFEMIPILDHGFIRLIDYMGNDSAIVQAARVSYGRGTKKVSEDKRLINYLIRHRHSTPFEMCEIKFHVKMPIFIARHWLRHRTASVNEYSARYSILDREFYIPDPGQLASQSLQNKQGREEVLKGEEAARVLQILKEDSARCYDHYEEMLNEHEDGTVIDPHRQGLTRELARMNLPVNCYTQFYWKIDLHNFMHFLSLRGDGHAQYEIRVYAQKMLEILKLWVPFTYDAFMKYRLEGALLSRDGLKTLKKILKGERVSQEESGLSKGEWRELGNMLEVTLEEKN
ncbi:MAG: FAD-dependent thymidylate synthase [Proteobacteria bacterium]|nr:FAD-dependent thymidylate synthase [Pseudomonadota bacterium]